MRTRKNGHKSRLTALVIDCLAEHYADCVAFWAAALRAEPPRAPRAGQRYTTLKGAADGLTVLIQRVDEDPGVHLDIETDSVASETARLEAAGARRKRKVKSWWVMQDPSGNAFCVVRPQQPKRLSQRPAWPPSGPPGR
jgi:hypothetical protein